MAERRTTVHDVAARAGVSLATVDRVLNRRQGVRAQTVAKVEKAIADIGFRRDMSASLLARGKPLQLHLILPTPEHPLWQRLDRAATSVAAALASARARLTCHHFRPVDLDAPGVILDGLNTQNCDAAIVVATGGAALIAAIDAARSRGVNLITLIDDLPQTQRQHFVGIDNKQAGRTAAGLLGRMCPPSTKVGIIAGFMDQPDQVARHEGFRSAMRAEFPRLILLGPEEGCDEPGLTGASVSSLVADHPDIAGIYAMGAGIEGVIAALAATGRAGHVRVVAHNLSPLSAAGLGDGALDAVIDQPVEHLLETAIAVARDLAAGGCANQGPSAVNIIMRHNLPLLRGNGIAASKKPA